MKMTTVKKGSKGEAVKQLQMLLGITADGIFGPKTKAAVKRTRRRTTSFRTG